MTTMIVTVLNFFRDLIIQVLPDISLSDGVMGGINSSITTVIEFISVASFVVPFPTIFDIISIVFGLRVVKFGVFLVNWVIRRIADLIP